MAAKGSSSAATAAATAAPVFGFELLRVYPTVEQTDRWVEIAADACSIHIEFVARFEARQAIVEELTGRQGAGELLHLGRRLGQGWL